jgi:hypothetical protein
MITSFNHVSSINLPLGIFYLNLVIYSWSFHGSSRTSRKFPKSIESLVQDIHYKTTESTTKFLIALSKSTQHHPTLMFGIPGWVCLDTMFALPTHPTSSNIVTVGLTMLDHVAFVWVGLNMLIHNLTLFVQYYIGLYFPSLLSLLGRKLPMSERSMGNSVITSGGSLGYVNMFGSVNK